MRGTGISTSSSARLNWVEGALLTKGEKAPERWGLQQVYPGFAWSLRSDLTFISNLTRETSEALKIKNYLCKSLNLHLLGRPKGYSNIYGRFFLSTALVIDPEGHDLHHCVNITKDRKIQAVSKTRDKYCLKHISRITLSHSL